jgi:hypothetical protein
LGISAAEKFRRKQKTKNLLGQLNFLFLPSALKLEELQVCPSTGHEKKNVLRLDVKEFKALYLIHSKKMSSL